MTLADISIFAQLHYVYHAMKREIPAEYKNVHAFMDRTMKATGIASVQDVAA